MIDQNDHRAMYIAMAALSGAVTALSFMPWRTMRWSEIIMTLVVGSSFAAFGVPYLVGDLAGIKIDNLRAICFFTYIGATGANAFVPVIIRGIKKRLEKVFGAEEAA
ncbi:hypothetical protein SP5_068_00990 [Sphingomonas parapaucimobilis NBRC 15100]|uniref:Uncharacterized protein n=2 Tax=Sphingomonas parapaucimobilis TaxID=28213 RepID=A0A0A1W9E3_9SPHN|nr:hypothetical protein SP5_068_00990 [Sphingomonas parapaucimobilis NBRC 15100]